MVWVVRPVGSGAEVRGRGIPAWGAPPHTAAGSPLVAGSVPDSCTGHHQGEVQLPLLGAGGTAEGLHTAPDTAGAWLSWAGSGTPAGAVGRVGHWVVQQAGHRNRGTGSYTRAVAAQEGLGSVVAAVVVVVGSSVEGMEEPGRQEQVGTERLVEGAAAGSFGTAAVEVVRNLAGCIARLLAGSGHLTVEAQGGR